MSEQTQHTTPGRIGRRADLGVTCRISVGLAGLALLSACAGSGGAGTGGAATGLNTNYYVAHAAGNYAPPGPANDPWGPYVELAAARFDVPARWIRQVMHVESGGHEYIDGQLTVSGAGAMGLMQLEPETYQEMAARYGLGADPFNPYDNIMAGTAYIHEMYEVYGSPGFLAAYNAGPGRLDSFMNYNRPLPDETTNYVAMIAPAIQGYYPTHRSEADQLALNTEPAGTSTGILPTGYDPDAPAAADTIEVAYAAPRAPIKNAPIENAPVERAPVEAAPAMTEVAENDTPPAAVQTAPAAAIDAAYVPPAAPQAPAPQPAAPQAPAPLVPVEVAAITAPATAETALYTPQPVPSEPQPAPPPAPMPTPHFSLIQPAMADTLPPPSQTPSWPAAGHAGWAIQVGAYSSRNNAQAALGIAELSAVQMLVHGQPMVVSFASASGMKYRARITNLPHDAAIDACQRLAAGPTGCVVLSPEVQG